MDKILVLSGPSLNLLGTREPHIYGHATLDQIHARLKAQAKAPGSAWRARQSNHEGELVDWIGGAPGTYAGIVLNPARWLLVCGLARRVPPCHSTVEVHLSMVCPEEFRQTLVVAAATRGIHHRLWPRFVTLSVSRPC